jgi:uncharacterized protein
LERQLPCQAVIRIRADGDELMSVTTVDVKDAKAHSGAKYDGTVVSVSTPSEGNSGNRRDRPHQRENQQMATSLTNVLQQVLQNTTNVQVLRQLMTPDATYVSLNFDNPELKKVMPWTGTHKGPQSLPEVFEAIQRFWKTLDFKVTDAIEQGNRVALFGSFTYKSNATGKEVTSPFGLLARFDGDKVAYIQFLEDSYGTAGSFKTGGATRFHSDPTGQEVEI